MQMRWKLRISDVNTESTMTINIDADACYQLTSLMDEMKQIKDIMMIFLTMKGVEFWK